MVIAIPGHWRRPEWLGSRCETGAHFERKLWVHCQFCFGQKEDTVGRICRRDLKPAAPGSAEYANSLRESGH